MNINFINKGSDEALLKSLQGQNGIDQGDLEKALDKSKLVQVERQVKGKNSVFTRKQWVKAGDVKSTDKVIGGKDPQAKPKSNSLSDEDIKNMVNNVFNENNSQKINKILGRQENSEGYPIPGKEGIQYKDASPEQQKQIRKILIDDEKEYLAEKGMPEVGVERAKSNIKKLEDSLKQVTKNPQKESNTSNGKFSPKDFGFRSGGQETVDVVNSIDSLVGVKSHTNGAAGNGRLTLKNGETISFEDAGKKGVKLTWKGKQYYGKEGAKKLSKDMSPSSPKDTSPSPSADFKKIQSEMNVKLDASNNGGYKKEFFEQAKQNYTDMPVGTVVTTTGDRGTQSQFKKTNKGWEDTSGTSDFIRDDRHMAINHMNVPGKGTVISKVEIHAPKDADKAPTKEEVKIRQDAATNGKLNQRLGEPKLDKVDKKDTQKELHDLTSGAIKHFRNLENKLELLENAIKSGNSSDIDKRKKDIQISMENSLYKNNKNSEKGKFVQKKFDELSKKSSESSKTSINTPQKSNSSENKANYFKANADTKAKVANMSKDMGNDKLLQFAKDNGVTWKENDHKGVNIMRMKMALAQAIQEGKLSENSNKSSGTQMITQELKDFTSKNNLNYKVTGLKGGQGSNKLLEQTFISPKGKKAPYIAVDQTEQGFVVYSKMSDSSRAKVSSHKEFKTKDEVMGEITKLSSSLFGTK